MTLTTALSRIAFTATALAMLAQTGCKKSAGRTGHRERIHDRAGQQSGGAGRDSPPH